jgi:hypothetical protein
MHLILGVVWGMGLRLSRLRTKIAQAALSYSALLLGKRMGKLWARILESAPTILRFYYVVRCDGVRNRKLPIVGTMRVGPRYLEPRPGHFCVNLAAMGH